MQDQVAGNFHEEVGNEENPCAKAVDGFGKLQIVGHLQFGETDVHPVQIGDEVAQQQQRQDTPRHFAVRQILEAIGGHGGTGLNH
ncbi:hypothetical protein D3C84_895100 [compost metagenome]